MKFDSLRILAAITAAFSLAACASGPRTATPSTPSAAPTATSTPATTTSDIPHRVVVGTKADQFGTGYFDITNYTFGGLDVDIAKYLSGKLLNDNDPYILPVSSTTRESALADGVIEFFVATYTILEERQEKAGQYLAGPYLVTAQGVMVGPNSPTITTLSDLNRKRVCTVGKSQSGRGSVSARVLIENVPDVIPVEENSHSACLNSLLNGNVDAFSTDLAILYGYLNNTPSVRVVKGIKIGNPIFYGVAFKRSEQTQSLCMEAAEAIKEMIRTKLWDNYFSTNLPAYKADFPEYQTQIQPTERQIDDNSCK